MVSYWSGIQDDPWRHFGTLSEKRESPAVSLFWPSAGQRIELRLKVDVKQHCGSGLSPMRADLLWN